MLWRTESQYMHPERVTKLKNSQISFVTWIYCCGQPGVKGNEMADHLTCRTAANDSLSMDKEDIIKVILSKLQDQEEDTDSEGTTHH